MPLIAEGIVTTLNQDDAVNISPMGPIVDTQIRRLELRPFATSQTYANLTRTGFGVFHVTDDVEQMARAALGKLDPLPDLVSAQTIPGRVIADACRWFEFQVVSIDDSKERISVQCEVTYAGRIRDFFGFNRAKHAVLEAAILATRLHILPRAEVEAEFKKLGVIVKKTAGENEQRAFEFLQQFLADHRPSAR